MSKKEEIPEDKIRIVMWMRKAGKTKKECCEKLGIPYNTKRLDQIIESFNNKEKKEKELREKAKKKEFSEQEKKQIAEEYLAGNSIKSIADNFYITSQRVKKFLIEMNIPLRSRGKKTEAKTEHVVQDLEQKFKIGDRVFYSKQSLFGYVVKIYDEEYIEYLQNPVSERFVSFANYFKDKYSIRLDKEGSGFECYYIYPDGKQVKRSIVQETIKDIETYLEKNGREKYLLYLEGDYARYQYSSREDLFPVEIK